MRNLYKTALVLSIIGAINWGLIGFFGFDLVAALFGPMTALSRIVYGIVGLAGITLAVTAFKPENRELGQRRHDMTRTAA